VYTVGVNKGLQNKTIIESATNEVAGTSQMKAKYP